MRIVPLAFGALTLCLAATAASAASAPRSERPNFVLCMTDDQGWGDVGYNGNPVLKTPHLDAMAASGVRFDRFYAAYPVCSPTRGSVLTGRNPSRFRSHSWGYDLPLREVTVAELVKTKGYATGHFGKWHLGGVPNADGITGRGVPESFDPAPRHPGHQGFDVWFTAGNWFDRDPPRGTFWRNGVEVGARRGDTSDIVMDETLQFIRARAAAQEPFLCVVWFPSPHGPWRATPEDRAPYAAHGAQADFYGEMAGVDRAMGRLRDELGRLGLRANTLVWFNSDNGAAGGSAGPLTGSKGNLWEGGIRVPGLIEWPARIPRPLRTAVPAGTVDILPTICDALGIAIPAEAQPLDGVSLLPILEGRATTRPRPLAFEQRRGNDGRPSAAALVDHQWKLLRVINPMRRERGGPAEALKPGDYLFDVEADVAERTDLSAREPALFARLRAQLDAFQASVEASAAVYPSAPSPVRLNPRLLQRTAGANQTMVERFAFPPLGWEPIGSGTRRHAEGALLLGGAPADRPGYHRNVALADSYLQFSLRLAAGGRCAVELGPRGAPVRRIEFDSTGVTVSAPGVTPASAPLPLPPGAWHEVLVEFAPQGLGVHRGADGFVSFPVSRTADAEWEGFALVRVAGEVAVKDAWVTAGEAATAAPKRGKNAKGKAQAAAP